MVMSGCHPFIKTPNDCLPGLMALLHFLAFQTSDGIFQPMFHNIPIFQFIDMFLDQFADEEGFGPG
jgi:hypothetical protein